MTANGSAKKLMGGVKTSEQRKTQGVGTIYYGEWGGEQAGEQSEGFKVKVAAQLIYMGVLWGPWCSITKSWLASFLY